MRWIAMEVAIALWLVFLAIWAVVKLRGGTRELEKLLDDEPLAGEPELPVARRGHT